MDKPKSLDSLFEKKLFRIPDYQRGYAWQREQLKDFWEDLINLSDTRSHYTGVLTLKQIPPREILKNEKEYWLVDDHSYQVYYIVDGQQRLTTFIIFLQAFVDFIKELPEFKGKLDADIYITESLNVAEMQSRYLFKIKPKGTEFRTYKFGYTDDNPSYQYLRFRILGEKDGGAIEETFYTLNLSNAKTYFAQQLHDLHQQDGLEGLQRIYKALTKRFLFNEYVIEDEFDVFVTFETMNNRGKPLSDLERLKNRLIYLTTLYSDEELDAASRTNLRETINDAWKEVYHQLGRNKRHPLNDDDFLRAHWIMYFKYSRKTGQDYIRFLLNEQFTPKKVHKKVVGEVATLEVPAETRSSGDLEDADEENTGVSEDTQTNPLSKLSPTEIRDYVNSLKDSVIHWFNSFYPERADGMLVPECQWIDRLNRVGMVYFRPLIMAILKNVKGPDERIQIFKRIERLIFILFRVNAARATYGSSEFYNAARELDKGEVSLQAISAALEGKFEYTLNEDASLRTNDFYNVLFKKFKEGSGYYGWSGLRYFLYEYELSLLSESRQKKLDWKDLLKADGDKISIEHIYPQTESVEWSTSFESVEKELRRSYNSTLGNLLLLSMSINSSLQNDSFTEKKHVKLNASGHKIRNGYEDGSHSEIEVSQNDVWGPEQIRARGLQLLKFMEDRWDFRFKNDEERERLLFLTFNESGATQHVGNPVDSSKADTATVLEDDSDELSPADGDTTNGTDDQVTRTCESFLNDLIAVAKGHELFINAKVGPGGKGNVNLELEEKHFETKGCYLWLKLGPKRYLAGVWVETLDGKPNKPAFDKLRAQKEGIEKSFGGSLNWDLWNCNQAVVFKGAVGKTTLTTRSKWRTLQDEMISNVMRIHKAFKGPIADL